MNEQEKILYAKSFIDKMANGVNPITDEAVKDDDMINNVRISRCLFYVSDILRQVAENGGSVKKRSSAKKSDYAVPYSALSDFEYSDTPITVSAIAEKLNDLVDNDIYKKITYKKITDWLLQIDFLYEEKDPEGKIKKRPTEMGLSIGIGEEVRTGMYGQYKVVTYSRAAQEFIIDNLHAVCDVYMDE